LPRPQPIRRSRGYAPFPIRLPFSARQILACGPELKNTFCLTRDCYAFVSQHIGDLENLETLDHFEATIELYKQLFRVVPEFIAYDMHPAYLSTRYAKGLLVGPDALIPVQHHHAHIASCLADNGWKQDAGPVIGVAWDGTGYGTDGRIWGGEFFVTDYEHFRRAGHLEYLPMPGGEAAIRNPIRLAYGYLYALRGQIPLIDASLDQEELRIIQRQIDRGLNCPLTSAGGRLFDAVSALLGIRTHVSYEAQAAMELEAAALAAGQGQRNRLAAYPFVIEFDAANDNEAPLNLRLIRLRETFESLLADREARVPAGVIAWRFHLTVADMICAMCEQIAQDTGLRTVALSGGCFQNRLLLAFVLPRLQQGGFEVLLHRQVPCNDGGISLGQAVIAHMAIEARAAAHWANCP
jgi:hydrogenase maturation protein HypF